MLVTVFFDQIWYAIGATLVYSEFDYDELPAECVDFLGAYAAQ